MSSSLKCRRCRNLLINQRETSILDVHGEVINGVTTAVYRDCVDKLTEVWYLQETGLPEWIISSLNEGEWQKGKLKCPYCDARIGSFDFISGLRCTCKKCTLPPVHIVKSKCDVVQK